MSYPFSQTQPGGLRAKTERGQVWRGLSRRNRRSSGASSGLSGGAKAPPGPSQKVLFEPLEPRLLLSADLMPFTVDMADVGDDITLKLDAETSTLEIHDTANPATGPLAFQKLDETSEIVIKGVDDRDDTLTVEFIAPFFKDITFDGGAAGFDTLAVVGGSFDSVAYDADGPDSGTIELSDGASSATITYAGLEPILIDSDPGTDFVFDLPDAAVEAELSDLGGGMYLLQSLDLTPAFEETEFTVSGAGSSVTINLGLGDDSLTISGFDATSATSLTIDGEDGSDTVTVTGDVALAGGSLLFDVETVTLDADLDAGTISGSAETVNVTSEAASIQDAIDVAGADAVLNIGAGTYVGDLSITTDGLELAGAGSGTTTIKGVATVPSTSFPLAVPNIDVVADNVRIHGFTIAGPDPVAGEYSSGMVIGGNDVEIDHNAFQVTNAATLADISQGIQTYRDGSSDLSGLNIYDNTFEALGDGAAGYEAIFVNHTTTALGAATIAGNSFSGPVIRAITTERSNIIISGNTIETSLLPIDGTLDVGESLQGILVQDFGNRAQQDVLITQNTIGGDSTVDGSGFSQAIRIGDAGDTQNLSNIQITENFLDAENDIGIQVRASADGVTVFNNSLGGLSLAVDNTDGDDTLNASGNWWGSADEGDVESAASGLVDFTPFLTTGDEDVASADTPGFQGDFSALTVTNAGEQTGATGRIQEGIDTAVGSTVIVAAGTYVEDLSITTDNLELAGAGSATTTIKGVATDPQADFPLATPNIDIQADGVKIHGFTIASPDAGSDAYSSGIVLSGTDIEIYNNAFTLAQAEDEDGVVDADSRTSVAIQTWSGLLAGFETNSIDGLYIHDNTFSGTPSEGYYGVYINPQGASVGTDPDDEVRIANNTFSGTIWRGISTERSNTDITGNEITTDTDTGLFTGNSGVMVTNFAGDPVDDVTIVGNTISGNSGFADGIRLGFPGLAGTLTNISVTDNDVSDAIVGVHGYGLTGSLTLANNNLGGNATAAVMGGTALDLTVTRDADMTLTGTPAVATLLIDPTSGEDETFELTGITSLTLEGGVSGNRLDASGYTGAVTLRGLGGNDRLIGGSNDDTLEGGDDDDTLTGGFGEDTLDGGTGGTDDDTVVEQRDADMTLTDFELTIGDEVDDLASIEAAVLTGGNSANTIDASDFSGPVILTGLGGDDTLTGGDNNDTLDGGEDADTLIGGLGNDTLYGGGDDDIILGDRGFVSSDGLLIWTTDPLLGGIDTIYGGSGDNTMLGGAGGDTITGGSGEDFVFGDHGRIDFSEDDFLIVSTDINAGGNDTIKTGDGMDVVIGGVGGDIINTAEPADGPGIDADIAIGDNGRIALDLEPGGFVVSTILEEPDDNGNDQNGDLNFLQLNGIANYNDTIFTGRGDDLVLGGLGDDVIVTFAEKQSDKLSRAIEENGEGPVEPIVDLDADNVIGDNGVARLAFVDLESEDVDFNVVELLTTDLEQGGNDTISTGEGPDNVLGGSNTVTIDEETGEEIFGDTIDGGEGDDLLLGDNARLILSDGEVVGLDRGNMVANKNFNPYGIQGIQVLGDLIGGDDTLEGGRGQDLLYGQRGNDTYLFWGDGLGTDFVAEAGAGNTEGSRKESFDAGSRPNDLHDRFDFSEFNGPVSIDLGKSGLKKINSGITDGDVNLQLKWFSNKTIEDIVGSQFADRLEGNGRDNVIIGLDGDDRIFGRSGDDVLLGGDSEDDNGEINREINGDDNGETNGDGNDKIGGGAGDDIIDGGDGDDTLHGDGGSDVILGGDGNDIIRGMRGNDFIDGEGGNDRIEGRAGQDVLLGGDGDDILRGGKGEDSVEGGDGDDDIREGGGRSSQEAGGVPLDPLFEAFDEVYEPANDFYDPQPEDDRSVRPWIEDYLDLVTGGIPSTGGVGLAATDGQSIGLFDTLVAMFEPASMAGGALGSDLQTRVFHEELDAVIDLEEAKQLEQVTGPVEMADLAEAEEELILPGWIPGRVAGSTGFSAEVDMAAGQQLAEGETADVPPVEAGVLDGLSVDWSTKFPGFLSNV